MKKTIAPVFLLAALGLALVGCAASSRTQPASRHVSTPYKLHEAGLGQ